MLVDEEGFGDSSWNARPGTSSVNRYSTWKMWRMLCWQLLQRKACAVTFSGWNGWQHKGFPDKNSSFVEDPGMRGLW